MLPLFLPPNFPIELFDELLFPLNDIIKQSAIFIEDQIMTVCETIIKVFDINRIQTLFLPSLDQLFIPTTLHPQEEGIAIRIQSFFYGIVDNNWKEKILTKLKNLAKCESTYVRICSIKSIPHITEHLSHESALFVDLIENVILPCFKESDFKVKTASIAACTRVGSSFFANANWTSKYLSNIDDTSWCVRFALAHQIGKAVQHCSNANVFAPTLIKLTKDQVTQIQSISLKVLSDCCGFFSAESLDEIGQIFEQGMISQFEEIRSASIDLWASLLKHHPNAPFHKSMTNMLKLLGVLPIESVTFKIMHNIIPLVDQSNVNQESIKNGFKILFDSPVVSWKGAAISIMRIYLKIPHLQAIVCEMADLVFQWINEPSFMVRCAAGQLMTDLTLAFSWSWFLSKPIEIVRNQAINGNSECKISIARTIVELLLNEPPPEIRNQLTDLIDKLENDEVVTVKQNAESCRALLAKLEQNKKNQQRKDFTESETYSDVVRKHKPNHHKKRKEKKHHHKEKEDFDNNNDNDDDNGK